MHRFAARAPLLQRSLRPAGVGRRGSPPLTCVGQVSTSSIRTRCGGGASIPPFGVVAAVTRDGVIGIDGGLPWKALQQDRDQFVELTRDKILIVGRRTFSDEDPTMAHVAHVRTCIVVSTTMKEADLESMLAGVEGRPEVRLARSFDEALDVASGALSEDVGIPSPDLKCWVAGGEGIYREALGHDSAMEVHLTHVDVASEASKGSSVAYFPLECLDRYGFEEVSRRENGVCTFSVYKRRPPDIR